MGMELIALGESMQSSFGLQRAPSNFVVLIDDDFLMISDLLTRLHSYPSLVAKLANSCKTSHSSCSWARCNDPQGFTQIPVFL